MRPQACRILVVLVGVLAWSPQAEAQEGGARLRLVPTVGWYQPVQDARLVGEGTEAAWTRVAAGPMLGVQAEWKPSVAGISVRGGLLATSSDLALRRDVGSVSCGDRCYRSVYRTERVGDSKVLLGVVDLLLQGPRLWAAQPYLALGGGVKHYRFDQGELSGDVAAAYPGDETDPTGHLGVGLGMGTGRYTLAAEAGSYLSTFDAGDFDPSPGGWRGTCRTISSSPWLCGSGCGSTVGYRGWSAKQRCRPRLRVDRGEGDRPTPLAIRGQMSVHDTAGGSKRVSARRFCEVVFEIDPETPRQWLTLLR